MSIPPIFPTRKAPLSTYGVAYEQFRSSPLINNYWRDGFPPDDQLIGDYDLVYTSLRPSTLKPAGKRHAEECLSLNQTVKGSLALTMKEGKLHGALAFAPEFEGALIPSTGSYTFVKNNWNTPSEIGFDLVENFSDVTGQVGRNCRVDLRIVDRRIPLGVDTTGLNSASKFRFNPGYAFCGQFGSDETIEIPEALKKAERSMDAHRNIEASWFCTHLNLPEPAAETIRHFLCPPPMLYVEPGDLVLVTVWDNRYNRTYTIARRRE